MRRARESCVETDETLPVIERNPSHPGKRIKQALLRTTRTKEAWSMADVLLGGHTVLVDVLLEAAVFVMADQVGA